MEEISARNQAPSTTTRKTEKKFTNEKNYQMLENRIFARTTTVLNYDDLFLFLFNDSRVTANSHTFLVFISKKNNDETKLERKKKATKSQQF